MPVLAKNISVVAHNTHIHDLFRDTLARVDGLSQEEFERFREDPSEFLAAYLLPLPEKAEKKAPKEDVLERARAVFKPEKCHARIWNSGYGCQCSRKAGDGGLCKKHVVHHKWGLYNEPKPEDVQWKCLPVEVPPAEVAVEVAPVEVAPVEEAPVEDAPAPVEELPIAKMKVAELREKLKENGLSPKGKKKELIERLEDHMAAGVGLQREVIPLEEKPKRKPRKKKEVKKEVEEIIEKDEEKIEKEAEQAVVERFAQLEADPEVYEEMEVYEYQDVEYYIDGDEIYDKLNPKRKVGTVDQDEDIIIWLSQECEREHEEKRGSQGDESDVSDSE
jgi:bacterioferritin (cytochrome b1)